MIFARKKQSNLENGQLGKISPMAFTGAALQWAHRRERTHPHGASFPQPPTHQQDFLHLFRVGGTRALPQHHSCPGQLLRRDKKGGEGSVIVSVSANLPARWPPAFSDLTRNHPRTASSVCEASESAASHTDEAVLGYFRVWSETAGGYLVGGLVEIANEEGIVVSFLVS